MTEPTRQICYVSPVNSSDPQEYVTEILIPLCEYDIRKGFVKQGPISFLYDIFSA